MTDPIRSRSFSFAWVLCALMTLLFAPSVTPLFAAPPEPVYYHLRQGVTFYIANTKGEAFDTALDLKDLNIYCQGPQTAMVKLYDPDGNILYNEEIPDDGIESGGYDQAWAGWDHELWARGGLRDSGTEPLFRWDSFSDPKKVDKVRGAERSIKVKEGKKGVYQLQVVGCDDHFVKINITPDIKFGVVGHPDFLAGHGDQFRTSYIYVPESPYYTKGREMLDLWLIEHAYPKTRRLTLFHNGAPLEMKNAAYKTTGKSMTADQALGRVEISLKGIAPGSVLKLVNEGSGDFLIRLHGVPAIFCPDEATAKFIAGGVIAIPNGPVVSFPWQAELYNAVKDLKKEDFIVKAKPEEWNKIAPEDVTKLNMMLWENNNNPADAAKAIADASAAIAKLEPFSVKRLLDEPGAADLPLSFLQVFYLYPIKGNGLYHDPAVRNLITIALIKQWMKFRAGEVIWEAGELNVAYAQGFHWNEWEPVWNMKEGFDPAVLKAFQKGAANVGQRMFYANGLELVLSNGRTTVPLNLYHAYLITGDDRLKDLSKRYLRRMTQATDGPHSGRSKSGYFREHFAADGGYCTYPLYQLGRLWNISGDPEVLEALDGLAKWMNYVNMRDGRGGYTGPTSWNARIAMASSEHIWGDGYKYFANKSQSAANLYHIFKPGKENYDVAEPAYEPGKPVPEKKTLFLTHLTRGVLPAKPLPADSEQPFFEDLGDGHEFFAIRRGNYYAICYAGKRVPAWMDIALGGQSSFNGGGIAGLSVVGKPGAVIVGRNNKEYGWPIEEWNTLSEPVAVGQLNDGRIFNTGVSRNTPAWDKAAWSLKTTGECVTAPVNYERAYQFNEGSIAASVRVIDADLNKDVFQYRTVFRKPYLQIAFAWELIPFLKEDKTVLTAFDAAGKALGVVDEKPIDNVSSVEIDNGRGGVRIKLDRPRTVKRSAEQSTVSEFKGPHAADGRSRALQIKITDKVDIGGSAELKYEIVPYAK